MIVRALAAALLCIAGPLAAASGDSAVFSYVSYQGHDPVDAAIPLGAGQFRNPILPGFHPDPSIVRVGNDYYLVNSSFGFYPGLPISHSRDLVNWTQIGNAIDRPDMLDFSGLGIARAVFAPTIRHHEALFYIVNTCTDCGGNFIITAPNAAGPWSKPVFLPEVDGIDAEIFFDDDGRVWITNNGPPLGTPRYSGHRALWIQELDLNSMKMTGPRTVVIDGGVKPADNPIWTEGPHIVKRDGWYYLFAAEGGTAGDHSETVFRSRAVTGPYVPGPVNPILTQRDLDPARPFPVYAAGHADLVQTPKGDWWAVFLATRPYEGNLSNMGRETFLLPVNWPKDGWPLILPPKTPVPQVVADPDLPTGKPVNRATWRDDFVAPALSPEWIMARQPRECWYRLAPHALTLRARAESISGTGNPSFLARRQEHGFATVETEVRYAPTRTGDRAGLAAFADEQHYYFVGVMQTAKGPAVAVSMRNGATDPENGTVIASTPLAKNSGKPIRLRVDAKGAAFDFSYAIGDGAWTKLVADADGRPLTSERSNHFTGVVIGVLTERGN
jgi:alpha-N-arabinofuranosidase